jgi:large subunit ribosomal protein L10
MNENLQRKHQIVDQVHKELQSANLAILAEFRGVDVANMSNLRRKARETNVRIQVVKNSLARRAAEDTDFECLIDHFVGPVALATSEDLVAVAKTIANFSKENNTFTIRTGALNGELLSEEKLEQIARLPSREELLGKLAGTLAAPIQRFVNALNAIPTGLVRVLAAVKDSKEEQ